MPTEKTWIILTQQKMLFRFSKEIPSKKNLWFTNYNLHYNTKFTRNIFLCLSFRSFVAPYHSIISFFFLLWLLITTREDIWRQQQQKRQDRYKKITINSIRFLFYLFFFTIEKENQNYQLRKVNEHWTYSSNSSPYVSSFSVSLSLGFLGVFCHKF